MLCGFPASFLETMGLGSSTHSSNFRGGIYALIWCGDVDPELVHYPYLTLNRFSFTVNDSVWSHYTVRARISLHHFELNSTHASSYKEDITYLGIIKKKGETSKITPLQNMQLCVKRTQQNSFL